MIFYGIKEKKTGKILGVECSGNPSDADFCGSYEASLYASNDTPWFHSNKERVQKIIDNPPKWYNSSVDSPQHSYKPEELEIFEVEIP